MFFIWRLRLAQDFESLRQSIASKNNPIMNSNSKDSTGPRESARSCQNRNHPSCLLSQLADANSQTVTDAAATVNSVPDTCVICLASQVELVSNADQSGISFQEDCIGIGTISSGGIRVRCANCGAILLFEQESQLAVINWLNGTSFLDPFNLQSLEGRLPQCESFAWHPHGEFVLLTRDFGIQGWNYPALTDLRGADDWTTWAQRPLPNTSVAFSQLNRALCSDGAGLALLIDLETLLPVGQPLIHPLDRVRTVAFSPDGKFCVTSCHSTDSIDCQIRIWNTETGTPVSKWLLQRSHAPAIAFSPGQVGK